MLENLDEQIKVLENIISVKDILDLETFKKFKNMDEYYEYIKGIFREDS